MAQKKTHCTVLAKGIRKIDTTPGFLSSAEVNEKNKVVKNMSLY